MYNNLTTNVHKLENKWHGFRKDKKFLVKDDLVVFFLVISYSLLLVKFV